MTTFFPGLQGRLYQSDDDKHIATPRFSMVPPQSSRIPRFSSGLQGIVAYMSVKDDLSPEQLDKLRSRFRMAGAYQEAAVVGLARAVIIAFDTRLAKKERKSSGRLSRKHSERGQGYTSITRLETMSGPKMAR